MCLVIPHISRRNKITVHDDADLIGFRPALNPFPKRVFTFATTIFNDNDIKVVSATRTNRTSSLPRGGRGKFYSDKNGGDCFEIRLTPDGMQKVTSEGLEAYDMSHEKGVLLISCGDSEFEKDTSCDGAETLKGNVLEEHTKAFNAFKNVV